MAQRLPRITVDLLSAAMRHQRDAEHLLGSGPNCSVDQACHLAGLAPECARKACLVEHWAGAQGHKAIGHGFGAVDEDVVQFLSVLDRFAHRYQPLAWHSRFPALQDWDIACRYQRTGTAKTNDVAALVGQTRRALDDVVFAMWADGLLPAEGVF